MSAEGGGRVVRESSGSIGEFIDINNKRGTGCLREEAGRRQGEEGGDGIKQHGEVLCFGLERRGWIY